VYYIDYGKFEYSDEEIGEVINFVKSNFINVGKHKKLKEIISRDVDDDNVLAVAIFEKVDCIVTGDKDLLIVKNYKNIKILSPRDFWSFEKYPV